MRRAPLTVLPDPGVRFQVVHHDDVATALVAAARGAGTPGIYNLAGPGELTARDLARALGWHSVPIPRAAVSLAAAATALPLVPAQAQWLNAFHMPVLMDTARARQRAPLEAAARRGLDARGDRRCRALAWNRLTECLRMDRTQSFGARRVR